MLHKFNNLVLKYSRKNRNIAFYAEKLNVSISYLNNSVKLHSGEPPGQIIRNKILLEAKRLLAHSNLNVAEIGYRLTFEDPSYFCRFFKRETQMTPLEFRSHMREKCHF